MKIDMDQMSVIRFNQPKTKTIRNQWYDSKKWWINSQWYESRNHESNQNVWKIGKNFTWF